MVHCETDTISRRSCFRNIFLYNLPGKYTDYIRVTGKWIKYCSVALIFQEVFRFLIYKLLRKTENGLKEITDDEHITDNKHILAYVSGLGFGAISGLFALVNVLADSAGPATMGLKSGTNMFFITSAAMTLCIILLHTFWSVIFFHACDIKSFQLIGFVFVSHFYFSMMTLLNANEMYLATLLNNYFIMVVVGGVAFTIAGGSLKSLRAFFTCK